MRAHAIDSALAGATSAGALHEPEAGVGLTIARELAVLFNALLFDRVEVFFLKGLGAQPGDRVLLD